MVDIVLVVVGLAAMPEAQKWSSTALGGGGYIDDRAFRSGDICSVDEVFGICGNCSDGAFKILSTLGGTSSFTADHM